MSELFSIKTRRQLKTHCYMGHKFHANNTRIDKRGYRHCRTCEREQGAERFRRFMERKCATPA